MEAVPIIAFRTPVNLTFRIYRPDPVISSHIHTAPPLICVDIIYKNQIYKSFDDCNMTFIGGHAFASPPSQLKNSCHVIPVQTGIQYYQALICYLDTRLLGYGNFLRTYQIVINEKGRFSLTALSTRAYTSLRESRGLG